MKLATTTGDFRPYCTSYMERLEHVCEAGFKYIDLDMYVIDDNDKLLVRTDWRDYAKMLKKRADELGAEFVQAHSPGGNPLAEDEADRLLSATIRSIEVCGELGIPNIVVHSGMLPGISKAEFFEKNRDFYSKLFPAMEKCNVNVLCENSTKANMGEMYFTNSGSDMAEFVKFVNHPLFHACWDTGHGNCEGNQYDDILEIGNDLYAVHINDNCGTRDEHLIPYLGTVNMDEIINALIDIGFNGYFTFEASSVLRKSQYWLGNRRTFEGDKRLLHPQLFMQKHLEKLMYDTGVYMLKQYNCYEE